MSHVALDELEISGTAGLHPKPGSCPFQREQHYGFHWTSGMFFNRLERGKYRGGVHVCYHGEPFATAPIFTAIIPENEWASIVSSMTALGETRETWMLVRALQGTL